MYKYVIYIIVFFIFFTQCKSIEESFITKKTEDGKIELIIKKGEKRNGPSIVFEDRPGSHVTSIKLFYNDILYGDSYFFHENGNISKYERYNLKGQKHGGLKYFNLQGDCIKTENYLFDDNKESYEIILKGVDTIVRYSNIIK